MSEEHLRDCLQRLADTRKLLDIIETDLRGAQEFRDAVFDLLEGTPFGAQADSTYDGLYGRLRAALTEPHEQTAQEQLSPATQMDSHIWCDSCQAVRSLVRAFMPMTPPNSHDATDLLCGECHFVIATIHHLTPQTAQETTP